MSEEKVNHGSCSLCEAMCGIAITHKDGKILSIKGDKDDPFSRGHVCPKSTALQDIHEDPDRLRKPIEKTSDGWREIPWDEALDKTAEGIRKIQKQYGRDSFGTYMGNPNVHNLGSMLMAPPLLHAINTKNKYAATSVDQLPHHVVAYHLFGHQLKIPVPDIDNTDHFLMLGANPAASNGSIMTVPDVKNRLKAITSSGGKVVVIDPRKTETAELATQHHFIKPGTDVLLLLAMLNTLFKEGLTAPGKLKDLTPGLDEIERYVQPYTPEHVACYTGISAADIRQLVTDFCKAERPVLYGRLGVSVQKFGLLCQYLIMLFNILTGRLDLVGGLMFSLPAANLFTQMGSGSFARSHSRLRKLPSFGGSFPVATLAEEILTEGDKDAPSIKGLMCIAGNPVLSTPNGHQLDEAFSKLEFMVGIDFYRNESNRHADIILPPVSPLERDHYDLAFHILAVRNTAKYVPALFKPDDDAMHDWQIMTELTNRLSPAKNLVTKLQQGVKNKMSPRTLVNLLLMTGPYSSKNPLKMLTVDKLLKNPHGIDFGPLKPGLPDTLMHKDKKIHLELDFYMADLERVEKEFFSETAEEKSSMRLIGRRHIRSNNSWLHNSHRLVKGKNRCTAMINNEDAGRLAIEDGQQIKVTSRTGSVEIEAEVNDKIMPGVVSIPHGWGHGRDGIQQQIAAAHPGVSINDLTDELEIDELCGNAILNGIPVDVVPVG